MHKLLLLSPYFFPEGPVPGKAFMEIRLCRQAHFSKIQQEISLSLQGGTETHTLNQDQSLGYKWDLLQDSMNLYITP